MSNMEEVIEIKGDEDGPISVILAGVHGDELCGLEAFTKIIPNLAIERGKIFFIYGNPRAIEGGIRYTEANLNRMFKPDALLAEKERNSYEYARAQFLKKFLNQAEALLDIHASSNPNSRKFLICEPNSRSITQFLPFDLVVSGFDAVEPGGTDYYMNSIGKVGICTECGYAGHPNATQVASEAIAAFLKARGHVNGEAEAGIQTHLKIYQLYLSKADEFTLSRNFADFEKVAEGELIGIDGNQEVRAVRDSLILFPHNTNKTGSEAFLLGIEQEPGC